jgi:hypothetical protein
VQTKTVPANTHICELIICCASQTLRQFRRKLELGAVRQCDNNSAIYAIEFDRESARLISSALFATGSGCIDLRIH